MNMNNMTPKERVEFLLAKQKELSDSKIEKAPTPIAVEEVKQEEVLLPELEKPMSALSMVGKDKNDKQNLIARFAIVEEDYSDIVLTEKEYNKVKRSTRKSGSGVASSVPITCRGDTCTVREKCLDGDTLILVEGLNTKKIKDIVVGDFVYSINTDLKLEKKLVTAINTTTAKVLYKLTTKSGVTLNLTANHPILMKVDNENIWVTLESGLNVGDTIYLVDELDSDNLVELVSEGDCVLDEIESIVYLKIDTVYDITVKDNESYIANSVVVHNCPYYQIGKAPVGRDCLVEVMLAEYWTERYIEDLNIDPNSISEVHYLSRLVEISILEERLGKYISIHQPDLMMDVITAVDDNGNEITNQTSSISFDQKERLDKQKMKILESLSSTRKEKLKIQKEESLVQNNTMVTVSQQLSELQKQFEASKNMKVVGNQ